MNKILNYAKNKAMDVIVRPVVKDIDSNITEISTTIGSFIIRKVTDKIQREITFTVGSTNYSDNWMEEALYGILYKYNAIKTKSRLQLMNKLGVSDGTGMYYKLPAGTHALKYRNYDIILSIIPLPAIQATTHSRFEPIQYSVITYNMDPKFVTDFEKDMLYFRNSLLKINHDSATVNVYKDYHESDGWTYWEKMMSIPKRRINTVYLPHDIKKQIVDTVNNFFASREWYKQHGIAHNLKILLYGTVAGGKDSIAKMIASEWNRNIYYITGGKDGKFIPNAITDDDSNVTYPLMVISDIDKYPFIINEPDIQLDKDGKTNDDSVHYKQYFGNMINALDGILSPEDRIIIMTTNHIEKFSETFLRPGRIDLKLEIPAVVPETFRKFTYDFFGEVLPIDIKLARDDIKISELQADVMFNKISFSDFVKKYVKENKKK